MARRNHEDHYLPGDEPPEPDESGTKDFEPFEVWPATARGGTMKGKWWEVEQGSKIGAAIIMFAALIGVAILILGFCIHIFIQLTS
jgi:hypothetical protein